MHYDEKSCGAVTYTLRDGEPMYLLVRNRSGQSGFPKGHVEGKETEVETALREILEETGVNAAVDDRFRREYGYVLSNKKRKLAVYFVARYEDEIPQALDEISNIWVVPYKQALSTLSFENDRSILRAADAYIRSAL
ncbi:MAG: NUDIX domain-containing protein [Clostridia bacterium]|nr:NUDIX domain-containing protein [Clostridia bacterium]